MFYGAGVLSAVAAGATRATSPARAPIMALLGLSLLGERLLLDRLHLWLEVSPEGRVLLPLARWLPLLPAEAGAVDLRWGLRKAAALLAALLLLYHMVAHRNCERDSYRRAPQGLGAGAPKGGGALRVAGSRHYPASSPLLARLAAASHSWRARAPMLQLTVCFPGFRVCLPLSVSCVGGCRLLRQLEEDSRRRHQEYVELVKQQRLEFFSALSAEVGAPPSSGAKQRAKGRAGAAAPAATWGLEMPGDALDGWPALEGPGVLVPVALEVAPGGQGLPSRAESGWQALTALVASGHEQSGSDVEGATEHHRPATAPITTPAKPRAADVAAGASRRAGAAPSVAQTRVQPAPHAPHWETAPARAAAAAPRAEGAAGPENDGKRRGSRQSVQSVPRHSVAETATEPHQPSQPKRGRKAAPAGSDASRVKRARR